MLDWNLLDREMNQHLRDVGLEPKYLPTWWLWAIAACGLLAGWSFGMWVV